MTITLTNNTDQDVDYSVNGGPGPDPPITLTGELNAHSSVTLTVDDPTSVRFTVGSQGVSSSWPAGENTATLSGPPYTITFS